MVSGTHYPITTSRRPEGKNAVPHSQYQRTVPQTSCSTCHSWEAAGLEFECSMSKSKADALATQRPWVGSMGTALELVRKFRFPGSIQGCWIRICLLARSPVCSFKFSYYRSRRALPKHPSKWFCFQSMKSWFIFLPLEFGQDTLPFLAVTYPGARKMSGVEAGTSSSTSLQRRENTARPCVTSLTLMTQSRWGILTWSNCSGLAKVPGLHLGLCDFSSPRLLRGEGIQCSLQMRRLRKVGTRLRPSDFPSLFLKLSEQIHY